MFQWLDTLLNTKGTITEEEIATAQEQINEDPEPENVVIFYNDEGNEVRNRFPLPKKFNKFMEDHTPGDLCELIDFCNNIMEQRPIVVYVDKDEKINVINNLKTLWWPDTETKVPLNTTSTLPDGCGLILLYQKGIEAHVY